MRDSKKKCICKKCDDCYFFRYWNRGNDKGEVQTVQVCSFDVLFDEIPRIRGSIDGCQSASNETRNVVIDFGSKAVKTIKAAFQEPVVLDHTIHKQIEDKNESGI